jgi:hypothetical protein
MNSQGYVLSPKYVTRRALAWQGLSWPEALILGHVLIYIGCIVAVTFFPGINVDTKVFYGLGLAYAGLLAVLLLSYARTSSVVEILLCNLLMIYMTVGFAAKLPFMLYFPQALWIVSGLPDYSPAWIVRNLPSTFEIFLIGYSAFVCGMLIYFVFRQMAVRSPGIRHEFRPPEPYRLGWLTILVVCLLVGKWLLYQYYLIGSPAVAPRQFPVPYVTGILNILMQQGLLYLVNVGLLHALASKRQRSILLYAFLILVFVGMDVGFSNKQNIVIEPIILLWIFIVNKKWLSKSTARGAIIAGVLIVAVGVPSYKYLNAYRQNLNSGAALSVAVQEATTSPRLSGANPLIMIYSRIVGLDMVEVASQTSLHQANGGGGLFETNIGNQFKQGIGIGQQQVVGFAFTQFGRAYAISGYRGMIMYMIIVAIAYFVIFHLALRYLVKRSASRCVLSAILAIAFLHYTMSGQAPLLTLKTLAVVFVVAFLAEKILETRGRVSGGYQLRRNGNGECSYPSVGH